MNRLTAWLACLGAVLFAVGPARSADPPKKEGGFRVAKHDGAWAFVDPAGKPFFSLGINCVNPAEDKGAKPPKYDGLARHGGSVEKWQAFTLKRLESWNVNTVGAWSSLRGKPYVLELSLSYSWIDVFDDEFEEYVRKAATDAAKRPDVGADFAALRKDPLLIGYFTDNELAWGWGHAWGGKENELSLFEYYATLKPDEAGKKAWAAYLAAAHGGDFKKLRAVWDTSATNEAELRKVKSIAPRGKEQHAQAVTVADGFLRKVAERYFAVTGKVMRGHLPDHLNLGTRLTPRFPDAVAEVAGRYVDVLSFNFYSRDLDFVKGEVERLHKAGGKPVLVTEFAFPAKANRSGNANKGYEQAEVKDDADRARHYERFVGALGELPFVVGCHWFQYHDQPTKGRKDGESCNFGFVDLDDRVYDDLAKKVAEVNAEVLKKRGANPVPRK